MPTTFSFLLITLVVVMALLIFSMFRFILWCSVPDCRTWQTVPISVPYFCLDCLSYMSQLLAVNRSIRLANNLTQIYYGLKLKMGRIIFAKVSQTFLQNLKNSHSLKFFREFGKMSSKIRTKHFRLNSSCVQMYF